MSMYDEDIKRIESEILDLEKQEEAIRNEKLEKIGVIKFLKSKQGITEPIVTIVEAVPDSLDTNEVIDLSKLNVPNQYRKTLMEDIWSVVSKFGEQEFMVMSVESVLKLQGVEIEGKSPRARIASTLGKLLEQGKLVQTFKGSGNIPHRYKLAKKSENATTRHSDVFDL